MNNGEFKLVKKEKRKLGMSEGNTKHCRASHRLGRMILK
jgi:hypothetical protein